MLTWLTAIRRLALTAMLAPKPSCTDLLLDWPNHHFPNPHWPYPDDPPSDHLLVMLHGAPERCKGCLCNLFGQPSTLHQTSDSFDNLSPAQAHVTSQIRFLHQSDPDRFTMDQPAIACE
jgi:hypothetical protein